MDEIAIGLMGCGRIARLVHVNALRRIDGARLAGIAEPDPEQREQARRHSPEAALAADYGELLESVPLDGVIICLPNHLHAEAAIHALERGKSVYLEKPLATNLDDGQRVVDAWRKAGVVGMVGFNFRHHPLHREARARVLNGDLGQVLGARISFSTRARALPDWKLDRRLGGGVLLDYGSHAADLARYLLASDVTDVTASRVTQGQGIETATLDMRMSSGSLAQAFVTRGSVEEDKVEIYGRDARLTLDRHTGLSVEVQPVGARRRRLAGAASALRALLTSSHARRKVRAPESEPSYDLALREFVEAVRTGRRGSPDLDDGLQSLAVVLAAEAAAEGQRAVSLAASV